jgi:DNA polymerase III subunit gamma/tau
MGEPSRRPVIVARLVGTVPDAAERLGGAQVESPSMGNPTYQSLYRRYRPQRFGDVLDQDHITVALRNAVRDGRVGHAYLFSGPRGCGKTSTARILAKVLNCANPADGEPCGICDNCVAVERGLVVDWLLEQDAASKSKVDDMRDLLDRVPLGTSGRRKVIILDEVHMLSQGAENALLKTLEEPPDHVVFVLATTDPQKVRPTIRSRTQHFAFHLVSPDVMADHMRHVVADAALSLEDVDAAVDHVVRVGGGSVRDTLSALDQVAALGRVVSDAQPVDVVLEAVAERDAGAVLVAVADAMATGRDPRGLGEALIGRMRNAFLALMGAADEHLPPAERESARALGERFGAAGLTRALDVLGEALTELARKPDPRVVLEVALVRLVRPDTDRDIDAILDRLSRLEQAVQSGGGGGGGARSLASGDNVDPASGGNRPAPAAKSSGGGGRGSAPSSPPPATASGPTGGGARAAAPPASAPDPSAGGTPSGSGGGAGPASAARAALAARQDKGRGGGGGTPTVPRPTSTPAPGASGPGPTAAAASVPAPGADAGTAGSSSTPDAGSAPGAGPGTAAGGPSGQAGSSASAPPPGSAGASGAVGPLASAAGGSSAAPGHTTGSSGAAQGGPSSGATGPSTAPATAGGPANAGGGSAATAPAQATGGAVPDMATLGKVWSDQLLGELPVRVRSKWRGGRWIDTRDGKLRFGVPNKWHLQACESGKLDVEKVLAAHFGQRIPVLLVDDEAAGGSPPSASAPGPGTPAAPPASRGPSRPDSPPPADDHDDIPHPAEIADLPDADVTVGGIELLQREFGGEMVQEERRD